MLCNIVHRCNCALGVQDPEGGLQGDAQPLHAGQPGHHEGKEQGFGSGSGSASCWIWIRIQIADPDPELGGQKRPTKTETSPEFSCF